MAEKKVIMNVNQKQYEVLCDPEQESIATVLRRIGLLGTKVGCGTGHCGACSIILDGKVVRSCARKMKTLKPDSQITTIEGIGTPGNLHPLQQAWITLGGVQCGFCSTGFIVSAYQLLRENINPTRQEVRDWFLKHRNACRCTGYKPLVDCVMAAAAVMRGEKTMADITYQPPADGNIYGTSIPRPAAEGKVTGTCDFGDDFGMKMQDTLHLAVVLPEVRYGKLLAVHKEEAEVMPGVVKVVTAADVKGINRITWPLTNPRAQCNGFDHMIFADKMIYHYGDICAVVVADTREHARAAAKKVRLEIEAMVPIETALEALAEDAPQINPEHPNMYNSQVVFKGRDTREVLDESAFVVEGSFYTQRQPHLVIEPDTAQAYYDENGMLTIRCKSLALTVVRRLIAAGIGVPFEKIRVIENPTGASFGYAISPLMPAVTAVCALAVERPVTITLSYGEHQRITGKRAPSYTNARLGCDTDGKLTAIEFEIAFDKGAYSEVADSLISKGVRFMGAPYSIPNAMGISMAVTSNNAYSTAYKGFGSPQTNMASEQLVDMLAEKAGIDPLEFRYRNIYRPGDVSLNGHTFDVYPMQAVLDKLRPYYEEAKARAAQEDTPEVRRGVGISCGTYNVCSGEFDHAEVAISLDEDGNFTSYNQWQDQGQGADAGTLLHTYQALRPLDVKLEQIRLVMNDTALCPVTGPAAGSRSHYMAGNAYMDAGRKLVAAMTKPDGTFRTYAEMVAEGIPTKYIGVYDTTSITSALDPNDGQGNPTPEYTYGAFLAEVAVDTRTGKTSVLQIRCVADVGVVAHPINVEGQAFGAMEHGIGMALTEDYEDVKKHGTLAGAGFPYTDVIPDDLHLDLLETPRPTGPHGSSGCAEMFQTSPHVAVLNGIYNACGVRIHELPATPARVLNALAGQQNAPDPYWLGQDFYERMDEIRKNPIVPK